MGRPTIQNTFTEKQISEILELSKTKSTVEIARMYGVVRATIRYHLLKNKTITWKKRKIYKRETEPSPIFKKSSSPIIKSAKEKNYKDYLKLENEKRKKNGLYLYKKPRPWVRLENKKSGP